MKTRSDQQAAVHILEIQETEAGIRAAMRHFATNFTAPREDDFLGEAESSEPEELKFDVNELIKNPFLVCGIDRIINRTNTVMANTDNRISVLVSEIKNRDAFLSALQQLQAEVDTKLKNKSQKQIDEYNAGLQREKEPLLAAEEKTQVEQAVKERAEKNELTGRQTRELILLKTFKNRLDNIEKELTSSGRHLPKAALNMLQALLGTQYSENSLRWLKKQVDDKIKQYGMHGNKASITEKDPLIVSITSVKRNVVAIIQKDSTLGFLKSIINKLSLMLRDWKAYQAQRQVEKISASMCSLFSGVRTGIKVIERQAARRCP